MRVRPAEPADALAVARVHVRAWQEGYRGLLPASYLEDLRPEDRAARYTFGATDPGAPATIVAVEGEAVVGFATIGPVRPAAAATTATGELLALHVDPSAWRRGVGGALMAAARERLHRDGHREAVLWILDGNERAARFYVRDGWTPDGAFRREEVWGIEIGERRYRRPLP